jgi:DNA-directed RNA polymerase subunit RPC12/RpoP
MPFYTEYKCSKCDGKFPKEILVVKTITFTPLAEKGRTLKSRVSGWLCPECLPEDEHWNLEPFKVAGNEKPWTGKGS